MLRFGVVIKMFADDAKLYAEIVTTTDVNRRRSALDAIETLCVLTIFLLHSKFTSFGVFYRVALYWEVGLQIP